jgi:bifunctional non-homologous end joining protein LigD
MPKHAVPEFVPPMMAESAKPFDSPDWVFEVKLDGYRAITVFDESGKSHQWSRNGLSLEAKFPAIARAVAKLKLTVYVCRRQHDRTFHVGLPATLSHFDPI